MKYTVTHDKHVVSADGENIRVIEDQDSIDLVRERVHADGQQKYWKERTAALNAELKEVYEGRASYGGIVVDETSSTSYAHDCKALADYLYTHPVEIDSLIALIAASKGFYKGASLPADIAPIVKQFTEAKKSPYFTFTVAQTEKDSLYD